MSKTEGTSAPPSGDTMRDRAVSLVKGIAGAVPFAGSLLAEVIGQLIPQQRMSRLEDYVAKLDERLRKYGDAEELRRKLLEPERVDLFEDGAYQSARALSEERRTHIANIVAGGLSGDARDQIEAKRILRLLGEVDDDQMVILASYLPENRVNEDFHARHSAVLEGPRVYVNSGEEERNAAAMHELTHAGLVRLGLLKQTYRRPFRGDLPELDPNTGMMEASFRELAQLGRILLARAGLAPPGAWEERPVAGLRPVVRTGAGGPIVQGWRGPEPESGADGGEADDRG